MFIAKIGRIWPSGSGGGDGNHCVLKVYDNNYDNDNDANRVILITESSLESFAQVS